MSNPSSLDDVRRSVMDSVEESEKMFHKAIIGFAVLEFVCWGAYILLAIFDFSLPVLIGAAAVCVYTTISAGLFGLKFHIDQCTQRTLQAIELSLEVMSESKPGNDDQSEEADSSE